MDTEGGETSTREVEDLRDQLLWVDPMVLTPPLGAVVSKQVGKSDTISTGIQTDSVQNNLTIMERMAKTLTTMNKNVVETLSQV